MIKVCIFLVLLLVGVNVLSNEDIEALDAEAKRAFDNSDYDKASSLYSKLNAEKPTYLTRYNLAVCYYKLKNWRAAQALFDELALENPNDEWVEINLALTLAKLGDTSEALDRLSALADFAESDYVATLAYSNYKKISQQILPEGASQLHEGKRKAAPAIMLGASLGLGVDSNVVSVVDEAAEAGSDVFSELTATAAWYSSPDFNNNFILDANAYSSKYTSVAGYNVDVVSLGARKHYEALDGVRLDAAVRLDQSSVGGQSYMRTLNMEVGSKLTLATGGTLQFGARHQTASELADEYEPYAGTNVRAYGGWLYRSGAQRWKLKYQWDDDSKNDGGGAETDAGNLTYTSYSARRHSLVASYLYEFDRWCIEPSLQFRKSDYKDAHVYSDDYTIIRGDTRRVAGIVVSRTLSDHWAVELDIQNVNNRSNIDTYGFSQNLFLLTLAWQN